MADKKKKKDDRSLIPSGTIGVEHVDGTLEELDDVREEFSLLIHEESRQAFPIPPLVPVFTPLTEGPYSHLIAEIYHYDHELLNPDADPGMVFGFSEAACLAAERGELQEDQEQKNKNVLTVIAALGGIIFPILMTLVSMSLYG